MFVYIKKFIDTCKCKVIFIINCNSILKFLYEPYIKHIYDKVYSHTNKSHTIINNGKRKTKHMIVTNYNI